MTEQHEQLANEFHRLKLKASLYRAQAIRSQIAAGLTFCRVAWTELDSGHVDAAHGLLERVRHLCERVHYQLNEPDHIPPDALENVNAELAQLESRIAAVEEHG